MLIVTIIQENVLKEVAEPNLKAKSKQDTNRLSIK